MSKYQKGMSLSDVMADDALREILLKHMPRAGKGLLFRRIQGVPLEELAQRAARPKRKEKLARLIEELERQ